MMRSRFALLALSLFLGSSLSCNKPTDYLYYHPVATPTHTFNKKIVEVTGNSNVDIFWLIGGMTEQQANFTSGINQFMTSFVTKSLSWRMAVACDNTTEPPYLGMPTIFDNTNPSPISTMVGAVGRAVNGYDQEVIFDPVLQQLRNYSSFIRPNAVLAVIMTNDNNDLSSNNIYAHDMLTQLLALKGGDASKLVVYGIFGAADLNCSLGQIDGDWNFHGSEFEKLITQTNGQAFSLCDTSFGTQLAKLGDNLFKKLQTPKLQLPTRPDLTTIHVFFHGLELPGGPQNKGGKWYFEINTNSIVFYDLSFAQADTEEVTIQYEDQADKK